MSGVLAFLLVLLILWRLYYIAKVVFTTDFFIGLGLSIVFLFLMDVNHRDPMFFLIVVGIGGFLLKRFVIAKPTIHISAGWTVASFIFMGAIIGIFGFLMHVKSDVCLAACVAGIFLMCTIKQFRLPWFVGIQICLLGLVIANVNDGGGLDGVDVSTAEASMPDPGLPMDTTASIGGGMVDTSVSGPSVGALGVDTSTVTQSYSVAPDEFYTGSGGDMSGMDASVLPADTASSAAVYQVSDGGMFPQESIVADADGNAVICDNTNVQTGTISHDQMGNSVLKDNLGNTVSHADAAGFVYDSDGTPIAQVDSNNGVNTYRDLDTGETVVDNRGFMTDENGIVGNITRK